jgi:[amino group carrier protein]-lysine/ornithine hydrolase
MDDILLLESLLRHYSPTGSENEAVNFLVDAMNQLGFESQVDSTGNAVGLLGDGPRELILLGHIDTVPGDIPVRREGDRLFGRGAVDAKGPLACFTAAAGRIGIRPGWRIVVIGALAEEGDSRGARGILEEYHPEAVIIGEPSGWNKLTLGYKGSAWVQFMAQKSMVHSAANETSACEVAVEFWNQVAAYASDFNQSQEKVFNQLTPKLQGMHSSRNEFSEWAGLEMNFRLPPAIQPDQLFAAIQPLAGEYRLKMSDGIPAYRAEKNTPLVRAFLAAIRAAGGQPGFSLKTGTADLNIVAPHWKVPALAYGPGDSTLDHTPDEHILISEYRLGIDDSCPGDNHPNRIPLIVYRNHLWVPPIPQLGYGLLNALHE